MSSSTAASSAASSRMTARNTASHHGLLRPDHKPNSLLHGDNLTLIHNTLVRMNREHYGVINALPQLARKYFSELFIDMMILSNPPRKVEEADSTTSATGDCAPLYAPVPLASQTVPLQQHQQPRQEVSTTQTYQNSFM